MEAVQGAGQQRVFLSAGLARPAENRFVRRVVMTACAGFIVTVPFVRLPLGRIPPFSPGYEAAIWIADTLTAVLLFSQFSRLRSRAVLLLAAGYLFVACLAIPHALSFPGVFSPAGLIGSGPQTTIWLYVFWHAGFSLFVLAYALSVRRQRDSVPWPPAMAIGITTMSVALAAVALTALATAGHDLLPVVVRDGDYSALAGKGISPAIWGVTAASLAVAWHRSAPTLLELWLMAAMVANLADVTLSGIMASNRQDLGFYAGRIYSLMGAVCVLIALLFEMNRLYAAVADALALAESRNVELARSREEFARVQRFEAIGQLVGGVAHDFNNLLTVITGALDLTLREAALSQKTRTLLDMSLAAAHRGAGLTGQLLTFARKQVLRPEVLNPNEVIAGLETFIASSTGERVQLVTDLSPVLWPVRLDRSQFETALVNLVVNARDALKGQGHIVISTRNVVVGADSATDLPAGDYVLVCVKDAGIGMEPEVAARAIEPFFTTKEVGKGSGLGLSQAYGFARAASGSLRITSQRGEGTEVEIYLPKSSGYTAPAKRPGITPIPAAKGGETVLVVEDDPDVLNIAVKGLRDLGYDVKVATNAQAAREILLGDGSIDLLFSDVVMPGELNGAQLAVEARRIRPGLKVLLTSGYTALALSEDHGVTERMEILHKPYRREELARKLRLVIGG
jgi:signal transduction histidine kinase/CheY-like chemotaxis protein